MYVVVYYNVVVLYCIVMCANFDVYSVFSNYIHVNIKMQKNPQFINKTSTLNTDYKLYRIFDKFSIFERYLALYFSTFSH